MTDYKLVSETRRYVLVVANRTSPVKPYRLMVIRLDENVENTANHAEIEYKETMLVGDMIIGCTAYESYMNMVRLVMRGHNSICSDEYLLEKLGLAGISLVDLEMLGRIVDQSDDMRELLHSQTNIINSYRDELLELRKNMSVEHRRAANTKKLLYDRIERLLKILESKTVEISNYKRLIEFLNQQVKTQEKAIMEFKLVDPEVGESYDAIISTSIPS